MRSSYKVSVRNPEETGPLGKPRRRWENIIKLGDEEIGWERVD